MDEETKLVCADCFVKQDAKDIVSKDGVIGKCDYCGQENVKVMKVGDIVHKLYMERYEKESDIIRSKSVKGGESYDQGGSWVNDQAWGPLSKIDRKKIGKQYVYSLTQNKELQIDLKSCLFGNKEATNEEDF